MISFKKIVRQVGQRYVYFSSITEIEIQIVKEIILVCVIACSINCKYFRNNCCKISWLHCICLSWLLFLNKGTKCLKLSKKKLPSEDGRPRSCLDQKGSNSESWGEGRNCSYNKTQDSCGVMFGEVKLGEADYTVVWETLFMSYILCQISWKGPFEA